MPVKRNLRTGRSRLLLLLGVAAVLGTAAQVASCACGGPDQRRDASPRVFTSHQFLQMGPATKQLGEDCTAGGTSECQSSICFHYGPDPASRYACSRRCEEHDDCPMNWWCISIYPAPGHTYCAPPSNWTPRIASPQPRDAGP